MEDWEIRPELKNDLEVNLEKTGSAGDGGAGPINPRGRFPK